MKCKKCKNEIQDDSIFCRFCGNKCVRTREKKTEIKVPAPTKLPSGNYRGRLTVDGQRISITAPNELEYYSQARALKSGLVKLEKKPEVLTLKECLETYVGRRDAVLSPSTVRGYNLIINSRFKPYMSQDVYKIDFQRMINEETALGISPKTVVNSWGLVAASLKDKGVEFTPPRLPQKIKVNTPWLDYEQLDRFINIGIRGYSCEVGALLAVHGLRKSEILAVTKNKVKDGCIYVSGALVRGDDGYVLKASNKNISSARVVPIFIPRLQELIDADPSKGDEPLVKMTGCRLYDRINEACRRADVPEVGIHGLRRSFASLCATHLKIDERTCMKLGGWQDPRVMRDLYIRLSQADADADVSKLKAHFAHENGHEPANATNLAK